MQLHSPNVLNTCTIQNPEKNLQSLERIQTNDEHNNTLTQTPNA